MQASQATTIVKQTFSEIHRSIHTTQAYLIKKPTYTDTILERVTLGALVAIVRTVRRAAVAGLVAI